MIGIGITTRNRNELVKKCITFIKEMTELPHKLVVVDDASDKPVKDVRVDSVTRHDSRKGIAYSKNDCILALEGCEHIFLFDDDCWPIRKGWESAYIEGSNISGVDLFCYTWESGMGYHDLRAEIPVAKSYFLNVAGKVIPIDEKDVPNALSIKLSMGYGYGQGHGVTEVVDYKIRGFSGGPGVMIYMNQRSLEKLGGFCEEYPMYGGEHTDLFIRAFNMGIIPCKGVDIVGSEDLFEALDRSLDGHSSTTVHDGDTRDEAHELMERRMHLSEKVKIVRK